MNLSQPLLELESYPDLQKESLFLYHRAKRRDLMANVTKVQVMIEKLAIKDVVRKDMPKPSPTRPPTPALHSGWKHSEMKTLLLPLGLSEIIVRVTDNKV